MKNRIGIMVPTRSRPERLKQLYESWLHNTEGFSEFVVGIDEDQRQMYEWVEDTDITIIYLDEQLDYVAKANLMATKMSHFEYLYLLADDFVINSRYETVLLDAAVKNCVYYGQDSIMNQKLPTAVFIDNHIAQTLGYIAPPSLVHYFADNVWREWGERLGTYRYFKEVNIQHLHKIRNKSLDDEVYRASEIYMNSDARAYSQYIDDQINLDIEKLQK